MVARIVRSGSAAARIGEARSWLLNRPPAEENVVVAGTSLAASEIIRDVAAQRGSGFGTRRSTLARLATEVALPSLAASGLTSATALTVEVLVARAVHFLIEGARLPKWRIVANTPGFARAVARTLLELRMARVSPEEVAECAPELAIVLEAYEAELARAAVLDLPGIFGVALSATQAAETRHSFLDQPTLLLDLPVATIVERDLVAALASRAPDVLATVVAGDDRSSKHLETALGCLIVDMPGQGDLADTQSQLFSTAPSSTRSRTSDAVEVLSAPGEGRECTEVARRVIQMARDGIAFDRMAVLLRSPAEYRSSLREAFERAEIPAYFFEGTVRPDASGRAFLALLRCAEQRLSAKRFAEYLSLSQVPDATADGAPPPEVPGADRGIRNDDDVLPERLGRADDDLDRCEDTSEPLPPDPETVSVVAGTLRALRRWERLIVDAAVIGGIDRWRRRLAGLASELDLEASVHCDDAPRADRARRDRDHLGNLANFALPLLEDIADLPKRATWAAWLDRLASLATRALRRPAPVISTLAALSPLGPVGPVELRDVLGALGPRLLDLTEPPRGSRYGAVFVGPTDSARGLSFDVVFAPGLAERLFPRKVNEDPILLDTDRRRIDESLATVETRIATERLALRLVLGAAHRKIVLSWPRLELEPSRARVPSFYALEVLRAAEGGLPLLEELVGRSESTVHARLGWPAPDDPVRALDESEYDLALLAGLLQQPRASAIGAARYLLKANPHLARALRFRARRWRREWTSADGIVQPSDPARAALAKHRLSVRTYSATTLERFAACPYSFFLHAVQRLARKDEAVAIDEMDPLQRGAFVHEVQFSLLTKLADERRLPVRPGTLKEAQATLDGVVSEVAAQHRERLKPAIARVWDDEIDVLRADLREWLRRASHDDSGFVPWRFEFSFGLPERPTGDPHSVQEPVPLECGVHLRGAIDLIERHPDGAIRLTDHKTGQRRMRDDSIVLGGASLQPVLYGLAAERLFPDAPVASSGLFYCTTPGQFERVDIALDGKAREAARTVAQTVDAAMAQAFLPAAPREGACKWCDFLDVCGPNEEMRTARKHQGPLAPLKQLRELP